MLPFADVLSSVEVSQVLSDVLWLDLNQGCAALIFGIVAISVRLSNTKCATTEVFRQTKRIKVCETFSRRS